MKSIGVTDGSCLDCYTSPKRELLYFDRLAITHLQHLIDWNRSHVYGKPEWARELEWLREQNLLFDPLTGDATGARSGWAVNEDLLKAIGHRTAYDSLLDRITGNSGWESLPGTTTRVFKGDKDSFMETFEAWRLQEWCFHFYLSRYLAGCIRLRETDDAVTIVPVPPVLRGEQNEFDSCDAVQVTIDSLPIPDEATSWEQITEFRNDPDSSRKHAELRVWVRELARGAVSRHEAAEKLDWLMHIYRQHMYIHGLKTKQGVLEVIITTTAEIAECIVTLKWSQAAKALFDIGRGYIHVLEEEAKAPGREVAYVVKAMDTFQRKS
jgi:hypothetical protein